MLSTIEQFKMDIQMSDYLYYQSDDRRVYDKGKREKEVLLEKYKLYYGDSVESVYTEIVDELINE